ncbi:hypothetical protein NXX09_24260 [Bacteroides uniformis]|nr:hypothetical protein [Bacteroides uniformis]
MNAGTTTGRRTGNGWNAGTISWSGGMPKLVRDCVRSVVRLNRDKDAGR